MGVPQRYDLEMSSCVNREVKVFNKKLQKRKKVHENLFVMDVNTDRDLHTRHGLHLNSKGKEYSVNQIVKVIKNLLHVSRKKPLVLKWNEGEERDMNTLYINRHRNSNIKRREK
jgi:hypothetical protein